MPYYSRKSPRIPNYDYSSQNYYFITMCTHDRYCIFGSAEQLSKMGEITKEEILKLPGYYDGVLVDHFVVMPNHIHMILVLQNKKYNLNQIIAQYKSGVSRHIHKINPNIVVWQRSYHDHVIRSQKSYEKIWWYIEDNPRKWMEDCYYINSDITNDI